MRSGTGSSGDHDAIEELLAGYALGSLSGRDAADAERVLAEHVPTCATCRAILGGFGDLAGELALATDPVRPPDLVLARIHRAMDEPPGRPRTMFSALAVSVVALIAMGGLSFAMANRASDAEDERRAAFEILSAMQSPGAQPVRVAAQGLTPPDTSFVEFSRPDIRRVYLHSTRTPDPAAGHAYQVWLGADGDFVPVGDMFVPEDGVVLLELSVDVARYDEIWITEEAVGEPPDDPNTGGRSWRASLI